MAANAKTGFSNDQLVSASKDADDSEKLESTDSKSVVPALKLEGRAEVTDLGADAAKKAGLHYREAMAALDGKKYAEAAKLFKLAGDLYDRGFERYRGQARYAEAQCRRMLGQRLDATRLYGEAADIFKKYEPDSPYLRASVEQLSSLVPLRRQVGIIDKGPRVLTGATQIDHNIGLRARITASGDHLSGQEAVMDVDDKFIKDSIHQCFIEMTCLETAELGSNYTNAKERWVPLMAYGKTAALTATDDFLCPVIKLKVNGKLHNVSVFLPGLGSRQRTVLLLTDGEKVCAIDPVGNDIWMLKMNERKIGNNKKTSFQWQKLDHYKNGIKRRASL